MHVVREFKLERARVEGHKPMDVAMVFPESNGYTQGGLHQLPPPYGGEITVIFAENPKQYVFETCVYFGQLSMEKVESHSTRQHALESRVLNLVLSIW